MGKFIKSTYLYIWFIEVVALLMMCLMWSVYLIDVEKMRDNAYQSYVEIEQTAHHQKDYAQVDFFTDSIMLNIAFFKGRGNPLYDALTNPRIESLGPFLAPKNLAIAVFLKDMHNAVIVNYSRYWHGYLVLLKPLLVFFDLEGIRYLNLFFQLGLLFAILYLMYKRLGFKHCTAFLTAVFFLNPIASWKCLEFTGAANVMLLATLWVLLNKNSDDNWIFFVIGSLTILFDFITFPLATLGIPLIVYLSLYERGFKDDVKCVIKNSLLWLIGYAGMWFMKWVLATLFTDYNVIKDGWENVLHRTYGITENGNVLSDITMLHSILSNVAVIWNRNTVIVLGVALALVLISSVFSLCVLKKKYKPKINLRALVLLGVGVMPFVWYSVLVNHSVVHAWITYRILAVSVYALLSAFVCSLCEVKNEK